MSYLLTDLGYLSTYHNVEFVGTDWACSGLWTHVWNICCYRLWAFRRPGMGRLLVYSMNISTFWHAQWENNKIGFWSQLQLCCCTWLVSLFRWAHDPCNVLLHIMYTHMFVWNPISLTFLFLVFIEFIMTKILGIQLLPHHRSENYRMTCTHELFYLWREISHSCKVFIKKIVADFQRFSEKFTKFCMVFTTCLSSMYRNLVVFLELLSQKLVIFAFN
jgi:hypothetical protein